MRCRIVSRLLLTIRLAMMCAKVAFAKSSKRLNGACGRAPATFTNVNGVVFVYGLVEKGCSFEDRVDVNHWRDEYLDKKREHDGLDLDLNRSV